MAILKVAQMGHPVLREPAAAVSPEELRSEGFQQFIADMIETMREYDGVGLAAPQVHRSQRVVMIESHQNPRYPEAPEFPLRVLVNPIVEPLTDETMQWWEGCLSVPGLRGLVHRPRQIKVAAQDEHGQALSFTAEDFSAIVIQHEVDHLNGLLFLDRMADLKMLAFQPEYERYFAPAKDENNEDEKEAD